MEKEIIQQELQKMLRADGMKWNLSKEYSEGKIEFRIAFQSDSHFIIHPLGRDGGTMDFYI